MIALEQDQDKINELAIDSLPVSFHPSFYEVYEKLNKWMARFHFSVDNSIFNDLFLLYLVATKQYLNHRSPLHLFRLVLSLHLMQKKLLRSATFSPDMRHLEVRWIPTHLLFPFSSKPVLGCLIGFNLMDRYEIFDEENIFLALQKYLPELRLVRGSSYCHTSQNKNLKIFYLEIEKKNGSIFTLLEQNLLKNNLEDKVKNSIQTLSPTIFMRINEEEIYKNVLVLSQEIQSVEDLPQAYIILDGQTRKEIVFRVTLVYVSPNHRFSLKEHFSGCSFVSQRILTVRDLENHPIEAHIFSLYLPLDPSLLRSDGSLNFYSARQKVVELINEAIGEFRDYNGGIIIKQQELLHDFKQNFPDNATHDPELMESFFYELTPLEKQVVLSTEILSNLFAYFLESRKKKLTKRSPYSFKIYPHDQQIFLTVRGADSTLTQLITDVLQEHAARTKNMAYNFVSTIDGAFFNCVLLQKDIPETELFIQSLREALRRWDQKRKDQKNLRIALESSIVSLDPRIGGEGVSIEILRLLFEGLTRFNQNGNIENAIAEAIEISPDGKQYIFKLRPSLWNDGSPVTAYDFEYAWKKVLAPDFKTSFAYCFYPIKNAKEAKEGKVLSDQIGIHVLDDLTLKVELERPTPYFLQWTACPLYSPVHRLIDQQHPQWPYQCEKLYPCNGPFQLKINQPHQGYLLIKNPYYWDAQQVALDQITLTLTNPTQAYQAFQKNEIDWIGNPLGSWHSFFAPEKEDQVIILPSSWICWFVFNTEYPLFQNSKLRQAFAYAIQRAQIIAESFLPLNPAYSPLLPHYLETCRSLFPDYNPEKARQLFDETLGDLNIRKEEIPPLSLIFHGKGIREYTALCLKKQFKECLGIECELQSLPWSSVFHKMTQGDFQMGLMQWTSWVDDPSYTLSPFKSAHQEINFAKWDHFEFQRLLDLSEHELNPLQRSSYLLKAEEILCQEMPIIPLFYQPVQALVKKSLNVVVNQTPCGPFNIAKSFYKNGD